MWSNSPPNHSLLFSPSCIQIVKHCFFFISHFSSHAGPLSVFFLVFQCAAVPQWAWKSSPWTKRRWWWAGNALSLSTTRPSPVTWSPTAGWNAMLPMRRPSPRREIRAWWVWLWVALTADRYQAKAVCQNRLHYFSFIKMDVVHTALIGLSRIRLFGSEGGCISDSVQRRWQVVMNSACVCGCWVIWGPRRTHVTHLSKNRHVGLSRWWS